MKCPACKSESVRRSRRRPADGAFRATFFKAYRCRECQNRFWKIANAPLVGAIAAASVLATFVLGIAAGVLLGGPAPGIQATTAELSSSAAGAGGGAGDSPAAPPGGDLALLSAAEEGDAKAQYQLGVAYLRGEGTTSDLALAYKWIEKSALQGYVEAQFALGQMHQVGRGALQSFPLAFKWYEKAAQQDHAEAQYRIGLMHRTGQGIPTDKSKAYVWFLIAAAQGHERARDSRDNLRPALTPEQLQEAQQLAQAWRPVVAKQ